MKRLPRRLALWGGAAAIAGGGFAFMAGNTVLASSAGTGAGTVSGYRVTNQAYTVQNRYVIPGTTSSAAGAFIKSITFHLTAQSGTPNARVSPTNVLAYPLNSSGFTQWGHTTSCTVTAWTSTAGAGTVFCTIATTTNASQPPVATFDGLRVEANQ